MIKAVLIDMDNTLLETQALYTAAEEHLVEFAVALSGADPGIVAADLQRRKLDLFDRYAYDPAMLPHAFEETLVRFVPTASSDDILQARTMAQHIFEEEARLKEGVADAIDVLAQHFRLYLVTAGHEDVQRRRIDALPFRDLFRGIFVVPDKTRETYEWVLNEVEHDATEAVMIGDSIKSDIIPAVEAGLTAIYIPGDNWQSREVEGFDLPPERVIRHVSLRDAAQYLAESAAVPQKKPLSRRNPGPRL